MMRIADFLAAVLDAHVRTLSELDRFLGTDRLNEALLALESSDTDSAPAPGEASLALIKNSPLPGAHGARGANVTDEDSPYERLDEAVAAAMRASRLPEDLEVHVWTYPLYRAFAENPVHLSAPLEPSGTHTALAIADEAASFADLWIERLIRAAELSEEERTTADFIRPALQAPWIRLRVSLLKAQGKTPFRLA